MQPKKCYSFDYDFVLVCIHQCRTAVAIRPDVEPDAPRIRCKISSAQTQKSDMRHFSKQMKESQELSARLA